MIEVDILTFVLGVGVSYQSFLAVSKPAVEAGMLPRISLPAQLELDAV